VTAYPRLRWTGAGDRFEPADQPGQVRIVDSWLVAGGQVRAFEAHARRFSAACAELFGIETGQTREFIRAAAARLPAQGRWFPRTELVLASGTPRLQLWIRPAPSPGRTVRLWLPSAPDARTCPRIKGPDLDWLARQREAAVAAGAGEAVLLARDGRLLEGSTTSILWWRDDKLCAPGEDASVLPGITRSVLLDAAAASGVPIAFSRPRPAELAGLEVWAVNALHGIRPVTGWVGADIEPGPVRRAARWQRYLDEIAAPVRTDRGKEPADAGSAVPQPQAWTAATMCTAACGPRAGCCLTSSRLGSLRPASG
jgi:branched-subunit amino acid aminotransferase/4-amino-4-deoxychorismate lyase